MSGSAGKRVSSDATNNDSHTADLDSATKKQKTTATTPTGDLATTSGATPTVPTTQAPPNPEPPGTNLSIPLGNSPPEATANPTGEPPAPTIPPAGPAPPTRPTAVIPPSIFRCPAHAPLPTHKATLCVTLDSVIACAQAAGQLATSQSQTSRKTLRLVLQGPIDKVCSTLKPLAPVKTQCTEYANAVAILSAQDATANSSVLAAPKGKKGQKDTAGQASGSDQGAGSQGDGETIRQMLAAAQARVSQPGTPLTICTCADAPGLWTVWGDLLRGTVAPSFTSNFVEQTLTRMETDVHKLKRAHEREAKDEKPMRELLETTLRLATGMQATQKAMLERLARTEEGLRTMGEELQQCNTQLGQTIGDRDKQLEGVHGVQQAENQRVRAETERERRDSIRAGNESQREGNERARGENEVKRNQGESWRVSRERERDDMEAARGHDEEDRATVERARVGNETARNQAEELRVDSEQARALAETSRETAEGSRVQAETRRDVDTRNRLASLAQSRQGNLQGPPPQAPAFARSQPPGLAQHVASAVANGPAQYRQPGSSSSFPQRQHAPPPAAPQRGPLLTTPTRNPTSLFQKPQTQQYDVYKAPDDCCLHVSLVPRGTPFPETDGEVVQILKAHGCAPHFTNMAHIHRVKPSMPPTQNLKLYFTTPQASEACKVDGNRAATTQPSGADRLHFDSWNSNHARGYATTLVGERAEVAERVNERCLEPG